METTTGNENTSSQEMDNLRQEVDSLRKEVESLREQVHCFVQQCRSHDLHDPQDGKQSNTTSPLHSSSDITTTTPSINRTNHEHPEGGRKDDSSHVETSSSFMPKIRTSPNHDHITTTPPSFDTTARPTNSPKEDEQNQNNIESYFPLRGSMNKPNEDDHYSQQLQMTSPPHHPLNERKNSEDNCRHHDEEQDTYHHEDQQEDTSKNWLRLTLERIPLPFFRPQGKRSYNTSRTTENQAVLYNTDTFHMYAIAAFADAMIGTDNTDNNDNDAASSPSSSTTRITSRKYMTARFYALVSLLLVCLQIMVLCFVYYEIGLSTCTMNTDCNVGSFCFAVDDGSYTQPRCQECSWLEISTNHSLSDCNEYFQDDSIWSEDIDETVIWYSKDYTVYYNTDLFSAINFTEDEIMNCMSLRHCENSKLAGDVPYQYTPGHLILYSNLLSSDKLCTFLFIAILFGCMISNELIEATKEDATLNIIMEQAARSNVQVKLPLVLRIIRLSIRLREIVVPILTGVATVTVLVNDDLSAKNIVLNFLALSYLLEADNILVSLLLTYKQRMLADRIIFNDENVASLQYQGVPLIVSLRWPKCFGVILSILIVVLVYYLADFMEMAQFHSIFSFIHMLQILGMTVNTLCYAIKQSVPCKSYSWKALQKFLLAWIGGGISSCFFIFIQISGQIILFSTSWWYREVFNGFILALVPIIVLSGLEVGVESFDRCSANRCCLVGMILCVVVLVIFICYVSIFTIELSTHLGRYG